MQESDTGNLEIRQLGAADWAVFREMRLAALTADPGLFSTSREEESILTEQEWQRRLEDPNIGIFILYEDGKPVGMTGVKMTDSATAQFWGSWIPRPLRKKGLSALYYAARFDWVRRRPACTRITVFHVQGNEPSKAACLKHGFRYTHSGPRVYNGETREADYYELLRDDLPA